MLDPLPRDLDALGDRLTAAVAPRTETNESSSLGYPYRALVHFPSGRFTYCKISGRPGEGSLTREFPVRVPAACGGDTARP